MMNALRLSLAILLSATMAGSGQMVLASIADQLPKVTVGQLRADPDKYSEGDFVVKGYVQIRGIHKYYERTQLLIESGAISHRMDELLHSDTKNSEIESQELWNNHCIDILDTSPLSRSGKLINNQNVVLRAKLIKDNGGYMVFCGHGLILSIEEVLDPGPATHPSRRPKP